ncbi:GD24026 [Drosophila simulans]|uniref:GD24026 n=1 Tax=Drosophila simulans TaxID=7240 RepID=B4Q6W5_DROSI|nr:GD24026 [Drosophila simulans]
MEDDEDPSYESYFDEENMESFIRPLAAKLTWTTEHLIDYKMFIAARRIQSFWRGYRVRKLLHLRWQAATAIQRWWRGFRTRHILCDKVERQLQGMIHEHFHREAIRIQALFRGWWVRKFIHDVRNLHRMQSTAAEDLINCIIHELHHIRKTDSIPGVISLRNSVCRSKVEKLLTTMIFRFHNGRVLSMVANKMSQKEEYRRYFRDARFVTQVPYSGPNFDGLCYVRKDDPSVLKEVPKDLRYSEIVTEYEESQLHEHLRETHLRFDLRQVQRQIDHINSQELQLKCKFCADVIERMRKWTIWDSISGNHKQNIYKIRNNTQVFFRRAEHLMSDFCESKAKDSYHVLSLSSST